MRLHWQAGGADAGSCEGEERLPLPQVLEAAHYACAANGLRRDCQNLQLPELSALCEAEVGGAWGAPCRPCFPVTPPSSAGHAPPLTAACCPRGPSQSLLSVGAAPCRLGVPNACGFLWEEEARGRSARGFGGPGGEDSTTALGYPNSPPSVGP